jgi:hypothetical protein
MARANTKARQKQPWHSVSVVPRGEACPGVMALREKRFLPRDAPALPLKDCARGGKCVCVYRHFDDRRAGPRRAAELTGIRGTRVAREQRTSRGRRESDHDS